MKIHSNIEHIRKSKRITQVELAKRLGIPFQTYNNYEKGKRTPSPETIFKISKELKVPIEKFFEEKIYDSKNIS
ncbi:helix-turn-helix domain-containing protein [Jeotgalibacillus proteolyticus]|uniref:helix-turn-helix domain-containing protein n=1 Tax=Jeotgalibacillus proteolyticus TaxID=2082395 RepID=UPI001432132D|nr:helix-turn-helix transcriptional regulator [Jeotgalibacillus proteolyticus]